MSRPNRLEVKRIEELRNAGHRGWIKLEDWEDE